MEEQQPQKIRRLKRLNASEVSLVNRGAVKRPFLIIKNQEGVTMPAESAPQFLLTPDQETAIDGVLAKHQRVAKGGPGSGPRPGGGGDAGSVRPDVRDAINSTSSAQEASREARKSNTVEDHQNAASAHDDAREKSLKIQDYQGSVSHRNSAKRHRDAAANLSARDSAAGGSDGVKKADSDISDALRGNVAADDTNTDTDDGLDERSLAALKAVFRILQPFKGQISEDMVDDVLAELDLDGTGDDGQDGDEDDITDDGDDTDDTLTEDDQAMADKFDPEDLKKAAAPWSPSKPDGMSDDDYGKACAAAKSAFNNIGKKADDADDEDEGNDEDEDDNVKKSAVTKSLLSKMLPEHAELVRKAEDARYEAIAKAAALEERVAKMEGERVLKSFEEDIKKDCITLGKDPAQQARILKAQFEANKEAGEQYRAILRDSARMTHETGIFKSVGTSHNSGFGGSVPTDGQGSPDQQLQGMLQSLVQKGEVSDEAAAWTAVMKTQRGRDLYELSRKGVH